MDKKALKRERILQLVLSGKWTQVEAAEELKLSRVRVNYLYQQYRLKGLAGIVSRHLGKRSNNRYAESFHNQVKEIINQPIYADFKPTLFDQNN